MDRQGAKLKLLVGASAGGHVNELLILLRAARGVWSVEPNCFVTTMDIARASFSDWGKPVHVLGEADRTKPFNVLVVLFRAISVVIRERPDLIVTTGSMPLAAVCLWAKLFGSKVVWIDSVAQVDRMSLSGRIVRPIADLCLVQWPSVAERYKNVEYVGEVF
jgi:UDP-N-acetylglucosamine:LPS N-acetylglucosamine transferase